MTKDDWNAFTLAHNLKGVGYATYSENNGIYTYLGDTGRPSKPVTIASPKAKRQTTTTTDPRHPPLTEAEIDAYIAAHPATKPWKPTSNGGSDKRQTKMTPEEVDAYIAKHKLDKPKPPPGLKGALGRKPKPVEVVAEEEARAKKAAEAAVGKGPIEG